jgi:hypothetical protein
MAGQNLNIRARRNAEISCVRGGLKVKARAWLHMLSEMGSLWLKSDAPDASDPAAATALANYQNDPERFTEGQDPVPVIMTRSIIMESTQGRSRLSGYRGVDVESTGTPREEDPDGSDVRVKSLKGKVLVESDNGVNVVSSGGHIVISSALDILMRMRFLTCVGSMFSFNDWVTFRADALHFARRILANTVSVMGTIRARSQTISVIKEENDIKFNTPVTLGHDSPMYNPPAPLLSDQLEGVGSTEDEPRTVADNLTYLPRKDPSVYLNNLRWDFGDVKYARFADEEGVMRLYESYTQQRLRLIEDLPSTHAEADLSEALVNEPVITGVSTLGNGSSKPWPGNAKAYGIDKEGSQENDLSTPSTLESDKWAPSRKKPMAPTDGIFRYIKLED